MLGAAIVYAASRFMQFILSFILLNNLEKKFRTMSAAVPA
jgi:hypothetical protein